MRITFKIWFLVSLVFLFSFNPVSSFQMNISDIDESFLIEPNDFITFNFTNTEESYYFLNQTINMSMPIIVDNKTIGFINYTFTYQAYIQRFFVDESNFIRFKNKETFNQIGGTEVNFSKDKPDSYQPVVNITYTTSFNHVGKIIIILNNINDFKITGFFTLKRLIFESNIQLSVPLKPIGDTTNQTTDFFFPLSLLIIGLILFKKFKGNTRR